MAIAQVFCKHDNFASGCSSCRQELVHSHGTKYADETMRRRAKAISSGGRPADPYFEEIKVGGTTVD